MVRIILKFCTLFNNLETMIGMILNLNPPGQNKIRPSNVFLVFCQFLLMLNIFQGHELAKRRGVVGWAIRFWTLSKSPGNEHLMQKILNLFSLIIIISYHLHSALGKPSCKKSAIFLTLFKRGGGQPMFKILSEIVVRSGGHLTT